MELETVTMDKEEVENIIVELSEEGYSSSEIGITLRDQYGVPDAKAVLGQKITDFLRTNDLTEPVPEDLQNLIDKAENVRNHLEQNRKDVFAKRGLSKLEARIRKLGGYYRDNGVLPADWRYRPASKKSRR